MVEQHEPAWLVIDGYEDEPAAFGVPPYVGFHIRYLCGVLEQAQIPYELTHGACTSNKLEKMLSENA